MNIPLPESQKKRIVIIGGGFGGLALANKLDLKLFQIIIIDKNNYHLFQPLLYQVATSGLEPAAISFPFRNLLNKRKDFYFRLAEVIGIDQENNIINTSIGNLSYDYLVVSIGTTTNFFNNQNIINNALPMKSVNEAITLQNTLLLNLEKALITDDHEQRLSLLNIVIVGGGATGVEIAGALSEMKRVVVPKDYPDLNASINIYLIEGQKILSAMSEKSSLSAEKFLKKMGITVLLGKRVSDYKDGYVILDDGNKISTSTFIWVSGVTANKINGFTEEQIGHAGRIIVDEYNLVKGTKNIYAIGDICIHENESYPKGHPQVAPVAIQQGKNLAKILKSLVNNKPLKPFKYKDKGILATIGRNKAVADLPGNIKISGFSAWIMWLFVHLYYILGIRNKVIVVLNWIWNYFNYSRSMRFIFFKDKGKTE